MSAALATDKLVAEAQRKRLERRVSRRPTTAGKH